VFKIFKIISIYVVLLLVLLLLTLVIIGGGYGSKEELPSVISSLERPVLFAHRGVGSNFTDDNPRAVINALAKGFSAVELDVQSSADTIFFTHHDREIKISNSMSYTAEEIYLSDKPVPVDQRVKSILLKMSVSPLSNCIEPYKYKLIFYLDMKRYGHDSVFDLAKDIAAFIKEHNLEQTCLVASAHVVFIAYLEYTNPEIITVLEGINTKHPWLYNLIPKKFKPDMIASRQAMINDDFVHWLKNNNMLSRYIVYHGDESTFQNDLDRGIEMFIVDYAPYLDRYLNPDSSYSVRRRNTK